MLKLEQIQSKIYVSGIDPVGPVEVKSVEPRGTDAVDVIYRLPDGGIRERMLFRGDEAQLLEERDRSWAFDADGEEFKLAVEAKRMKLAHLFDRMMAVHTANIEPLPHQITAVYESLLPRQHLRYVLADDPGAGKTIMSGLYIHEMVMRSDVKRVLIIAPGGLVDQWQDEMAEKFGLEFSIFTREMVEVSRRGNPFEEKPFLIARLDQLARSDDLKEMLKKTQWDLIIVDEAHKMAAHYSGGDVDKTSRFQLGEELGKITRHFLLLTATPHSGKEEDFQLFMSLLDPDRFYGKFREGVHKVDTKDLMRRMVKEQLLKFDGTHLFPERQAHTVSYLLSPEEMALYEAVTAYVRNQFDAAKRDENKGRRNAIGFAVTTLQRRLASSPEAILRSLERRHKRLREELENWDKREEEKRLWDKELPDEDELTAEENEEAAEKFVTSVTASRTKKEFEREICELEKLEECAKELVRSDEDSKWQSLSRVLQDKPEMKDGNGRLRKLIIFTEHRDTVNYLVRKIRGVLGQEEAVVTIHGGVKREERRKVQDRFRQDDGVMVLVATDAAGEGINLQNAHLMINYDLPWNPNRLEQRFGRIHRIGQTEVCHLWNLVATETLEGQVFERLFKKLETIRAALKTPVFDILGKVSFGKALSELLVDAICSGSQSDADAVLDDVDAHLDLERIKAIQEKEALYVMDEKQLFKVRDEMVKAEARKLQPYFVGAFFKQAFEKAGGVYRQREANRYEIMRVPMDIKTRSSAILDKYERICFDKEVIRQDGKPVADLMCPKQPLMEALIERTLEKYQKSLKQGAVFIDPNDLGTEAKVMVILDHAVREVAHPDRIISRKLQFVAMDKNGGNMDAGYAPHLDLKLATSEERLLVQDLLKEPWLSAANLEKRSQDYAAGMVKEHYQDVQKDRNDRIDKIYKAVHERLEPEITYWSKDCQNRQEVIMEGKSANLNLEKANLAKAEKTRDELIERLNKRDAELEEERYVTPLAPVVVGSLFVVPKGLILKREQKEGWLDAADAAARKQVEEIAMAEVMRVEREAGCEVKDVSEENCGWDITSWPRMADGRLGDDRCIEVKGRVKGSETVTVTRNEYIHALNLKDKFILAIVLVDGDKVDGPYYIRRPFRPFEKEPDDALDSLDMKLKVLLARAEKVGG